MVVSCLFVVSLFVVPPPFLRGRGKSVSKEKHCPDTGFGAAT